MSATNLTKNLKLSQFVASDKPSWLGDVNGDNKKIDDGYGVLAGEISKANDTASSAKSQSDANTQTLTNVNSELEDYGNRITALEAGGGTEQLEQRVNTLGTDVEALQTRADTFEGNITQNGTDITALKGRVDTIEPKVKANADNIKSLQTSNTNILSEIDDLHTVNSENGRLIANAQTTATNAQNKADSISAKLSITDNNVSNLTRNFNEIKNNVSRIEIVSLSKNSSRVSRCSPIKMHITNNNIYFDPITVIGNGQYEKTSAIQLGTFDLPSEVNSITFGAEESNAGFGLWINNPSWNSSGAITTYVTLSGRTFTLYVKVSGTVGSGSTCFNLYLNNLIYE